MVGVEPTSLAAHEFESCVFANFTTSADVRIIVSYFFVIVKILFAIFSKMNYNIKVINSYFILWEK